METIEFKVQEFKNMTLNPDDAVADVNEKGRRICQVEIHEIPRVLREYTKSGKNNANNSTRKLRKLKTY